MFSLFRKKKQGDMVQIGDDTEAVAAGVNYGATSSTAIGGGGKMLENEGTREFSHELYCIVLKVGKYKPFKTAEAADEYRQVLINDLVAAGLDVTCFYSSQKDEIFIKVGAKDKRLLMEADHVEHVLELDPDAMRTLALSDKDPNRAPIHLEPPFPENQRFEYKNVLGHWTRLADSDIVRHIHQSTRLDPFAHLYARYNDGWEVENKNKHGVQIYKIYPDGSILRTSDRIKLILIIMERSKLPDMATGAKGAGLNLQKMRIQGKILAAFPLQQNAAFLVKTKEKTLDAVYEQWSSLCRLPWAQPLDDIRDYFGERVALYFAFLGHYTMWLAVAGTVGFAVFLHQLANIQMKTGVGNFFNAANISYLYVPLSNSTIRIIDVYTEVPEAGVFSLFIAFWATFMLEFWKRKQSRLAMRWGTSNFEAAEVIRPEFIPTHFLPNPVTGKSEPYYSPRTFQLKVLVGVAVICTFVVAVISMFAGIFVFKVFVTLDPAETGLDQKNGTYIALIVNAVAINLMGTLYKTVALILNEWENHRTDTQFDDALIIKVFIFCFCNSYSTLFYLAFIKSGTSILGQTQVCEPMALETFGNLTLQTARDGCFATLGSSLLIVFLVQIIVGNTMEVVVPTITGYIAKRTNLRQKKSSPGAMAPKVEADEITHKLRSNVEDQYFKKPYEGTFDDFLELALQFGYSTLFVAAFPVAPFLSLLNNMLEVRVDSYKLCKLSRRPHTQGAQDIGSWQGIFYLMGLIAVLTNAGIVFFTSTIIEPPVYSPVGPQAFRVWMWVLSSGGVVLSKLFVDYFLRDVPTDVAIQLQRQEYLVRKCLVGERDDEEMGANDDDPEGLKAGAIVSAKHEYVILSSDPTAELIVKRCAELVAADANFDIESAFEKADRSGNGLISTSEFKKMIKRVGGIGASMAESDIETVAEALDYDGNGSLNYQEFKAFINRARAQQ